MDGLFTFCFSYYMLKNRGSKCMHDYSILIAFFLFALSVDFLHHAYQNSDSLKCFILGHFV